MDEKKELPDCLKVLTLEELAKVKPLTEEEIRQALEKGREEKEAWEKHYNPCKFNPDVYFK